MLSATQPNSDTLKVFRPEVEDLVLELARFARVMEEIGHPARAHSSYGLRRLEQLPTQIVLSCTNYLRSWRSWISADNEFNKTSEYSEFKTLRRALSHYGVKMDPEFWKVLTEDHLIELYNKDMIQIYRSVNFLELSSYSILDLMTNEWYVLWDRPKVVTDRLLKIADRFSSTYVAVQEFPIERHLLREVLDTGLTEPFVPRATLVDFKHIGTLTSTTDGSPQGFICTSKGRVMASGEDAQSISCI